MMTTTHYHNTYLQQVRLLARLLISVNKEKSFALKGGTAINFFIRDLPRLSIDIDLTYLPLENRAETLKNIESGLLRIQSDIEQNNRGIVVNQKRARDQRLQKLIVGQAERIKIEPNEVLRGALYPIEHRPLTSKTQALLGLAVGEIQTLSFEDLYAGKICAALDRQHPRDLFDIYLLYRHEGITDRLRKAFVVYLASGPRPMHELLQPNYLDQRAVYRNEFVGMALETVSYDELAQVREQLVKDLNHKLTTDERRFLVSVKKGEPDYSLMSFKHLEQLPALQWKVINVRKMEKNKQVAMLSKLRAVLEI
jgi:predicted nucleotidyltransferase component of viral defense system